MTQFFSRTLRFGAWLFSGFALFTFLVLPMQSVWSRLHLSRAFVEKNELTLSVFFGLMALISLLFSRFFGLWKEGTDTPSFARPALPRYKWKAPLLVSLASIILIRAIAGIEQPFDNDELTLAMGIIKGEPLGPLFFDSTHPLSSYLGILSAKVFGLSMWSLRLPSLLFCACFLIILVRFSLSYAGMLTGLLLIGHLASSAIFVWYFHSTRGNAPMVLLCFFIFSLIYSVIVYGEEMNRRRWAMLIVSLLLMPLAHGFAAVFGLLLPIAVIAWTVANHGSLSGPHRKTVFRLNAILLAPTPYFIFVLGNMFYLKSLGDSKYIGIAADSPLAKETLSMAFTMVLGASHAISTKLIVLFTLGNIFYMARKKNLLKDLSFLVLIIFLGFVSLQRGLLGTHVTGRYFLGVLPIFMFWFIHTIESAWPKNTHRYIFPILLFPLVLFPILDGAPGTFQLDHQDYYAFVKSARKALKGISSSCVEFSHSGGKDPSETEAFIASKYYFAPKEAGFGFNCPARYQMHFASAWPSEDPSQTHDKIIGTFNDLPTGKTYKLVRTDGNGRFLASIESNK